MVRGLLHCRAAAALAAVVLLAGCRTGPGDLKDDAPGHGPPRIRFDEAIYRREGAVTWAVLRVREDQSLTPLRVHQRRHETDLLVKFRTADGPCAQPVDGEAVQAILMDHDTLGDAVLTASSGAIAFDEVSSTGGAGTLCFNFSPLVLPPGCRKADEAPLRTLRGFFRMSPAQERVTRYMARGRAGVVRALLQAPERVMSPAEAVRWLESSAVEGEEGALRRGCVEALSKIPAWEAELALQRLMRSGDPVVAPTAKTLYQARREQRWW